MSTDRDVASLLRSWLRSDLDGPADHVLAAALAEIDTTPQRRATWWPARRSLDMNLIVKFGVATAALAMAVVLGYGLWQNIGNQAPAPDQPEASDQAGLEGELPPELQFAFIGEPRDVPGLDVEDRLLLDLRNQVMAIHTGASVTRLVSLPRATGGDGGGGSQLRLETVAETTECTLGDVGTYSYALSPGGSRLTIDAGEDDCALRAEALAGVWHRAACLDQIMLCLGPMEAGTYSSLYFDPFSGETRSPGTRYGALTFGVQDGWANAVDASHQYVLARASDYDAAYTGSCHDCPDTIALHANPRASRMDCVEELDEAVGASADALADWIRAHPGLQVDERPTVSVDGRQGFVLDITTTEEYADACVDAEAESATFVPLFTHPGYSWGIRTGDRQRLILVELDADTAMLIGIDTLDPATLDAFVEETQPIIDSLRLAEP